MSRAGLSDVQQDRQLLIGVEFETVIEVINQRTMLK